MTRTLRHDLSIPEEIDGSVRFDDVLEKLKVKFLLIFCSRQSLLGWVLWQEEERRRGFNTAWILILWIKFCTWEQFMDIQENISLIHCCKTLYCYRMTSPSTSTTSGTPSRCIPLFKVDWFREDEATGRTCSQCSSRLWTRLTFNLIKEKLNTIWINPQSHRTNTLRDLIAIRYFGAI